MLSISLNSKDHPDHANDLIKQDYTRNYLIPILNRELESSFCDHHFVIKENGQLRQFTEDGTTKRNILIKMRGFASQCFKGRIHATRFSNLLRRYN